MIKKRAYKKGMALSQIIILIFGTIAFSYIIGSEIGFVSAADSCTDGQIDGSRFCYSLTDPHWYTVTSATTLSRSDGRQYVLVNGQWTYNGQVLGTATGDPRIANFNSYASTAIVNFNAQSSSTTAIPGTGPEVPPGPSSIISALTTAVGGTSAPSTTPTPVNAIPWTGGENPANYGTGGGCTSNSQCPGGNCDSVLHVCVGGTGGKTPPDTPTPPRLSDQAPTGIVGDTLTSLFGATAANGILNIAAAAGIAASVWAGFSLLRTYLLTGIKSGTWEAYAYTGAQFLSTGATFGAIAVPTINTLFGTSLSVLGGGALGAGLALLAYLAFYKTTKTNAVLVQCIPWQAPSGGADCGKCGQDRLPCTAYQCASLGTSCELLNTGAGEGKPICSWIDQGDTAPPTISFMQGILPEGYTYEPSSPPAEYPKDTGVLIKYNGGNIPPYTTLPIGVSNDKISKCKIDYARGNNISEMGFQLFTPFGGINGDESLWGKNHTLNIPIFQNGSNSVQQSGETNLYVRCESRNGYSDVNAFVIQFNVNQTPDQTAPEIRGTDILNGAPIAMGTTSLDVHVYVNEPVSGCKWSHSNYDYANMENNMTCPNIMSLQGSFAGTFPCTAHLDGLNDNVANSFYFLCNDTAGNVAREDKINPFVLRGTQSLAITSVTPINGTVIKGSTNSVKVTLTAETSGGSNQGEAICSYSDTGTTGSYRQFSTNSYKHSVDLYLNATGYTYYIKCKDLGNNIDEKAINFVVETDTSAPLIVRASHENANLNIKTNEEAKCVYDIVDCNYPFENGISMPTTDSLTHSAGWVSGRTYYIKCKDLFNNQPSQDACTAILSSSQI